MNWLDWISIIAAFAVTGWFMFTILRKDRDDEQHAEDDARAFFDAHGHWPDETPDDARARAEVAAAAEQLARRSSRGG